MIRCDRDESFRGLARLHSGAICAVVLLAALGITPRGIRGAHADGDKARQAAKLVNRGIGLLESGEYTQAETLFRRALALAPEKGAPHYYLGVALVGQDRCEEAVPEFDAYLADSTRGQHVEDATRRLRECEEAKVSVLPADDGPSAATTAVVQGERPPVGQRHAVLAAGGVQVGGGAIEHSGFTFEATMSWLRPRSERAVGLKLFLGQLGGNGPDPVDGWLLLARAGTHRNIVGESARLEAGLFVEAGFGVGGVYDGAGYVDDSGFWLSVAPEIRFMFTPRIFMLETAAAKHSDISIALAVPVGITNIGSVDAFYSLAPSIGARVRW